MATFNYGGSDDESDAGFEVLNPSPTASSESCSIHLSPLQKWHNYFQKGTLQDHQRLCALKSINVNICQFLDCENKPNDVKFFKGRNALVRWTKKNKAFFPKRNLPQGSPLRTLLKLMVFGKH
ncbi:uncharacterized protein B0J16DRAFT_390837 [Fusarium flagelliforme]|uniref:uncharacterized protein n=1 Tax=Fusarium flagelliforme TaxID=2675880 RepID=UPI001E8D122B|nr:uncharacterized protein B0J16DRAFT_390837 [Fusarium flagelliforme]KAH7196940.1 hypothetical protein B0J16DRAFT_390837 [Fusarium flagelliforme]